MATKKVVASITTLGLTGALVPAVRWHDSVLPPSFELFFTGSMLLTGLVAYRFAPPMWRAISVSTPRRWPGLAARRSRAALGWLWRTYIAMPTPLLCTMMMTMLFSCLDHDKPLTTTEASLAAGAFIALIVHIRLHDYSA